MIVNGNVEMSINMHVIGLETDAVEIDRYGNVTITDPDQFFIDWDEEWNSGVGELMGACDLNVNLDQEKEDEEDMD